jgi:hypothetical protein
MDKIQNPLFPNVTHHRQNSSESTYEEDNNNNYNYNNKSCYRVTGENEAVNEGTPKGLRRSKIKTKE